ncbi:MAG: 16S rRNA (uracil(1498)-N(3))-methyltransferase [Cyclobacteriaceae bacterium]|nr:16S rRNA (uracil(1498)-N(3))-methyltransferase [Cyclobacteriaceae bacterium]
MNKRVDSMLFYEPGIKEGVRHLDPDESRHCIKVLRHKRNDSIRITDGRGFFYDAVITLPDASRCVFEIQREQQAAAPGFTTHIAIAPTKQRERTDWFVEKAVEIGVNTITFMECEHGERTVIKLDRLVRIAVSAMKQSLRAFLPDIQGMVPFEDIVRTAEEEQRFITAAGAEKHLLHAAEPGRSYCVLIGPEGDFSARETAIAKAAGFLSANLGPSRLRTETAGLAAVHSLMLVNL